MKMLTAVKFRNGGAVEEKDLGLVDVWCGRICQDEFYELADKIYSIWECGKNEYIEFYVENKKVKPAIRGFGGECIVG